MKSDKFIKVHKDEQSTRIREHMLPRYLAHGWKKVKEKKKEPTKDFDKYTKKQLIDIGKNNGVHLKERMNKTEMIAKLEQKKHVHKPSNKGFTDNLIK